jgi:hypothetical protein
MDRFVIQVVGESTPARGQFVRGFYGNGLFIVTPLVGGTSRPDGNGTNDRAILFADRAEAEKVIKAYRATKLPRGYAHTRLAVVPTSPVSKGK